MKNYFINDSDRQTQYESITVASRMSFDIDELTYKINIKKSNTYIRDISKLKIDIFPK